MENKECLGSPKEAFPEELPSLFKYVTTKSVAGFDNVEYVGNSNTLGTFPGTPKPGSNLPLVKTTEAATFQTQSNVATGSLPSSSVQLNEFEQSHAISFSMPSSPSGLHFDGGRTVPISNGKSNLSADPSTVSIQQQKTQFHSQPISTGSTETKVLNGENPDSAEDQQRYSRTDAPKDKRFDPFKTWSGRLERQLSNLRGRPQEPETETNSSPNTEIEALPVDRYFDALEGPELDTLKASEISVLPDDKQWPFLLRFPISSFGICLGVSSQAILWKTLATSSSIAFLHVSLTVNLVLWFIALALVVIVFSIYILKIIFYFEAVRREYYHPVRVNFFFAPWIACLFLALGVPPSVAVHLRPCVWYLLMSPILCLELKIYGQWMSGGQRRLSKVANPSNHLSIVGNFVGALLGATMGLKEGPIFFFAVGLAHYTVLFVTLYQRLPTNETLPKELHPVFFLFVAAPSVACTAWAKIRGNFDYGSRIAFFIALFLYFSLAVRINFFRGFRFSLAWWAYTFPMTGASIAMIRYSMEVTNPLTQTLSIALSGISTFTVTALLVTTVIHAFILKDLFPNDKSIAISERRQKPGKKHSHLNSKTTVEALDLEAAITVNILGHQLSV